MRFSGGANEKHMLRPQLWAVHSHMIFWGEGGAKGMKAWVSRMLIYALLLIQSIGSLTN